MRRTLRIILWKKKGLSFLWTFDGYLHGDKPSSPLFSHIRQSVAFNSAGVQVAANTPVYEEV